MVPSVGHDVACLADVFCGEDVGKEGVGDVADGPGLTVFADAMAVEDMGNVVLEGLVLRWSHVALFALALDGRGVAAECRGSIELEDEGLVAAVVGGGARVDAEFDDAVAPGAIAEVVAAIGDCVFS